MRLLISSAREDVIRLHVSATYFQSLGCVIPEACTHAKRRLLGLKSLEVRARRQLPLWVEVGAYLRDHVVGKDSIGVCGSPQSSNATIILRRLKPQSLDLCFLLPSEESLHGALASEIFDILIQPFLKAPQMISLFLAILRMIIVILFFLFLHLSQHLLIPLMSRHVPLATASDDSRLLRSIAGRGLLLASPKLCFPSPNVAMGGASTAESASLMSRGFIIWLVALLIIYFL